MLFPAPARVIDFDLRIVANVGEEFLSEKTAVVGKLRPLVSVAKAFRDVRHRECQRHDLAGLKRMIKGINAVQVARRGADRSPQLLLSPPLVPLHRAAGRRRIPSRHRDP